MVVKSRKSRTGEQIFAETDYCKQQLGTPPPMEAVHLKKRLDWPDCLMFMMLPMQ
jgi:hypothetical protein